MPEYKIKKNFKVGRFEWWSFTRINGDDEWRWRLKSPNGKIVCQSEGYTTKESCLKGIASVKRIAEYSEIRKSGY